MHCIHGERNKHRITRSPSLGNLKLELGDVGHIVLHSEPELSIPGTINPVLLQLFPQRLLLVYPAEQVLLCLVLETKVADLWGWPVCGCMVVTV